LPEAIAAYTLVHCRLLWNGEPRVLPGVRSRWIQMVGSFHLDFLAFIQNMVSSIAGFYINCPILQVDSPRQRRKPHLLVPEEDDK
jgi:hypothetical protein